MFTSLYVKLAGVIGAGVILASIYFAGVHEGKSSVQDLWDAETQRRKGAQALLEVKEQEALAKHVAATKNIAEELNHENQLLKERNAAALTDYANRLRNSEERANRYSKQAEAGTSECRSLASKSAQLDRTLEEGRILVIELRDSIELKDKQLMLLGKQIESDRATLGE